MTALESFTFPATGQKIRSIAINGAPWFVGRDAAAVLDIANPRSSLALLDADERGVHTMDSPSGPQEYAIISESGLYSLILRSRKPEARAFRRWITGEVIPSIRRTGAYAVPLGDPLDEIEAANDRASRAVALARAERQRAVQAEARAAEGEQFRSAIEGGDGLTLRAFHKKHFSDVRETTFFGVLYDKGLLIDQLGKGTRRADGTARDGAQHRHPTFKGKPYFYLHTSTNVRGRRFENTRVRPGEPELELRAYLVKAGLTANTSTDLELAR